MVELKEGKGTLPVGIPSPQRMSRIHAEANTGMSDKEKADRAAYAKAFEKSGEAEEDAPDEEAPELEAEQEETTLDADPGDEGDSAAEDPTLSDELRAALLRDNWKNSAIEALLSTETGAADLIETAQKAKARQAEEQRVFDRLRELEKAEGKASPEESAKADEPSALDALEPVFDELSDEAGNALKQAFRAQEARIAELAKARAQDAERAQAAEAQAIKAQVDATRQELSGVYPEFQDPEEWQGIYADAQRLAKANDEYSVQDLFEAAARYRYGRREAPPVQAKNRQPKSKATPSVASTAASARAPQALTQEQIDRAAYEKALRKNNMK